MCHSQALTSPGWAHPRGARAGKPRNLRGPGGQSLYRACVTWQQVGEGTPAIPASQQWCWEPAQSSPGSQGCLGTAGQPLSCRHPWVVPAFLLSASRLAGLPAPGARCRAEPGSVKEGMVPQLPCPGEPCVTQGHPGEPSEVPRSGPAGHGAGDLPGALMCSLWQPALP